MIKTASKRHTDFKAHSRSRIFLSTADIIVFTLIAGILASFRAYYVYGLINHIENIPPIQHIADPSLFTNDWHVLQSIAFGPRYYYYHLIAFLTSAFPLDWIMGTLTFLSNIVTVFISYLVGRDLFKDDGAAIFGCVLIGAVHSIDLGMATFLIWENLVQASLAEPLAMLSIWAGIRLKPTIATIMAALSALVHPVVGLETGGIALGLIGLSYLIQYYREDDRKLRKRARSGLFHSLIGFFVLVLIAFVIYLGSMEKVITDEMFFRILVYFRNPHHYVPSQMGGEEFGRFFLFMGATGLAWYAWWRSETGQREDAIRTAILIAAVLIILFIGWFFVEVLSIRTVASMQLYRMVYLIKWIGLLLIGRSVAVWFRGGVFDRWTAVIALSGTGVAQPLTAFVAHMVDVLRKQSKGGIPRSIVFIVFGILSVANGIYAYFFNDLREYLFLIFLLAFAAWFMLFSRRVVRWAAPLVLVIILLPLVLVYRNSTPILANTGVFTIADAKSPYDPVALWARAHLPKDAIVVVPPMGGRFRLVAQRAIVVDFKSFVFQDTSIVEWMERISFVYGETDRAGFAASAALDRNYRAIDDKRLAAIADRYHAEYAVLYRETETSFPVLFEDERFKLILINPSHTRLSHHSGGADRVPVSGT